MQRARDEGNLFHSREMTSIGMLIIGVTVLLWGTPHAFGALRHLSSELFLMAASTPLSKASVPVLVRDLIVRVLWLMAPYFLVVVVASVALNLMQSGVNLTLKPLMPKGSRMNPMKGIGRIFSSQGAMELLKAVLKIVIVGPIAYATIKGALPEILALHTVPLEEVFRSWGGWLLVLLAKMLGMLLVLSAIDFAYQKWKYKGDMKMTQQEVRDEAKESEGNPQVKGKQRKMAREMLRRPRLDHAVLKADVVVTNPTHYAVALRYDPSVAPAPQVLAKGIRKRALRIKELAREHNVPTIENRPLARALYNTVPELAEIPEELFPAVAAVLAEIYRQRRRAG